MVSPRACKNGRLTRQNNRHLVDLELLAKKDSIATNGARSYKADLFSTTHNKRERMNMSQLNGPKIYALTTRDVERLRCLLHSVTDAVTEIIDYRAIGPIESEVDSPAECSVYQQTIAILSECDPMNDIF